MHPGQQEIYHHPARFKVVAAGRRFGKTVLAVIMCILSGLEDVNKAGKTLRSDAEVVYIGVDREQAKRNAWHLFKDFTRGIGAIFHENTAVVTLPNGVRIRLLGMDNPDAARGMKLRFAVLDEYADMPPHVWPEIIRPALMDVKGEALFIGTPKGKNHFFELFQSASAGRKNWRAFNFSSQANPYLDEEERADISFDMSREQEQQELEAKFISRGGKVFQADDFKFDRKEPTNGSTVITVDLAGFSPEAGKRQSELKKRDKTAIAIVKLVPVQDVKHRAQHFWWVKQIIHGQWDPRQTAFQIVKAAYDNECLTVGIEKGALKYAVEGYLQEYATEYGVPITFHELTHGNKAKADRIEWALAGRVQKGRVILNADPSDPNSWAQTLIEEAVDFPDPRSHDDLLDALAYVDQMAPDVVSYYDFEDFDETGFVPLDEVSGF
jgi:hypothetical protein